MDEDGEERARAKRSGEEVDWISNLPDSLLCQRFKLKYDCYGDDEPEIGLIERWINAVVRRKVEHLDFSDDSTEIWDLQMPRTLYTCESSSLLSFTHVAVGCESLDEDLVVVIDAPRLEYLKLSDFRISNFIIKNPSSLVEACIDTLFNLSIKKKFDPNNLAKRTMIRNFLVGISCVKDLIIASYSLEVIYDYSRCESLPLFRNLSFLHVVFTDYRREMLPVFLASCPNLKSLVVGCSENPEKEGISIRSGPRCLLSSLEYVEIERPLKGEAKEMKLVSYLLESSKILKKLTLSFDDSVKKEESGIFRELLNIPRLSSSCQIVVL